MLRNAKNLRAVNLSASYKETFRIEMWKEKEKESGKKFKKRKFFPLKHKPQE